MFDFNKFVAQNTGKTLREWEVNGIRGILVLSKMSALQVGTLDKPEYLGLHLVASYDKTITKDLSVTDRVALLASSYLQVDAWLKEMKIDGEMALAQQEQGWGTQPHFHVHFYVAPTRELATFGYKPRRCVDPISRLEKL